MSSRSRSIISQLLVAFAVFAVLIGVAAATGYLSVTRNDSVTRQLTDQYQVLQRTETSLQGVFGTAESTLLLYTETGEHSYILPVDLSRMEFNSYVDTLQRLQTSDLRGLISAQAREGAAWFALAPRIGAVTPRSAAARTLLRQAFNLEINFGAAVNGTQQHLQADVARLTAASKEDLGQGLAWGGAALTVAVLLILVSSLSTLRTVTGPLRRLAATVRRLETGDHAARAAEAGSAEVREVARSVNSLAAESDRLRTLEAERIRLMTMAREASLRIREHLVADDVLNEARQVLETSLGADVAYLRLVDEGRLGPLIGHEPGWFPPAEVVMVLEPGVDASLKRLFRAQRSQVIQDMQSVEANRLTPVVRDAFREAGVAARLVTPFGVGTDMLGIIVACRMTPGRPWADAEVAAVEAIAADLGRSLHHARLYEAENHLVTELRALDRTKSDFLATISHELRTPLTSIAGYVEVMQDGGPGPLTEAQVRMLDTVDRNADRLRSLIEDVLTLSKIESGAFKTTRQPVNLEEVLAAAVAVLQPETAAKGLALHSDWPGEPMVVMGDPGQLDRVLMNLLSNAVKFTPPGGQVQVSAERHGRQAVLTITDTGVGIPENELEKLFTRFYRATNARFLAIPGSGLGLAIVRTIVANHGGTLSIASQEGEGTTVTVSIPLQPEGSRRRSTAEQAAARR